MRKVVLFLAALAAILGLSATADAESPYRFGPHDVQCQASPDQPNCVGGH